MQINQELLKVCQSRRSVRFFHATPVPPEMIHDLLESGRWAPSGSNIQAWKFCVVQDTAKLKDVAAFSPGLIGKPPLLILLCVDERESFDRGGAFGRDVLAVMDISMAAQNMMLVAESMGLGTCVLKSFNAKGVAKILKLPEHIRVELILSVGFPAKHPAPPKKKSLSDIVFYDEWKGI